MNSKIRLMPNAISSSLTQKYIWIFHFSLLVFNFKRQRIHSDLLNHGQQTV